MKILGAISLAFALLILAACGGGSSSTAASGQLTGNWQLNLSQQNPITTTPVTEVSGFLVQSGNSFVGSVEGPTVFDLNGNLTCGGTASVSGTVNGQNVTFSENLGGTTFNFTGSIDTGNKSMSGSFESLGGACSTTPITGTWSATLVPPLNGNFTGTFSSTYEGLLQGSTSSAPVKVSGSFTQSSNAGASQATVTGTITAAGYPCFTTVSLSGTISGQNVYLNIFNYNGDLIGTLGAPGPGGSTGSPATVVVSSSGTSLSDTNNPGLIVGLTSPGPCPPIGTNSITSDNGSQVVFNLK